MPAEQTRRMELVDLRPVGQGGIQMAIAQAEMDVDLRSSFAADDRTPTPDR